MADTTSTPPQPPQTPGEEALPNAPRARFPGLPALAQTFEAFRFGAFRLLFVTISLAGGGYFLQQVVIGWLIYDVTKSPFITSLVASLEAVPLLIMSPFGGFLVDAMDRRKVLAAIYAYQGGLAAALGLGVITGYVAEAQIIAFMLLVGFSWTVNEPAVASIIANSVPRKGLINAFALSNMGRASTRLAIPALGGLMIEYAGGGPTLIAEAVLFFIAAAIALTIRVRVSGEPKPRPSEAIAGLIEGAKYVKGNPNVLALLVLQLSAPLFMYPFIAGLLPVYAAEVYNVGPSGLGLLYLTGGLGMLIGAALLATLSNVRRRGVMILLVTAVATVAMAAVSLLPWFIAGMILLTVVNGSQGFFYTATNGAIQAIVPDNMRGRIAGLSMATWGGFPVTALLAGALAEWYGVQVSTFIGSVALAVYTVVLVRVYPSILKLE